MLDWAEIDTVLLDMDGTLLDLHFDHLLWNERLPERYAARFGLSLDAARAAVGPRLAERRGTLAWYCLDHWSSEFGLDISALEHELAEHIRIHADVERFLDEVRRSQRRLVLATNAHRSSLRLKMARTGLAARLDRLHSAHDFGYAKEDARFWAALHATEGYDPDRTLLIDDNVEVLRAAERHGLRALLAVRRPNSRAEPLSPAGFPQLSGFAELLPVAPRAPGPGAGSEA